MTSLGGLERDLCGNEKVGTFSPATSDGFYGACC